MRSTRRVRSVANEVPSTWILQSWTRSSQDCSKPLNDLKAASRAAAPSFFIKSPPAKLSQS